MKKKQVLAVIVIFCFGIGLLLYPFIASWTYQRSASQVKVNYRRAVEDYTQEDLDRMFARMAEYNQELANSDLQLTQAFDPEQFAFDALYMELPTFSAEMGYVSIPAINVTLPIYHTTERSVLEMGAGHVIHTSLPIGGEGSHAVISAHSGLPDSEMFTNLNQLSAGNIFVIEILGETLTYQVYDIEKVLPDEISSLTIQTDRDLVTLVTCTPLGINSHRLLVHGERIPNEELEEAVSNEPAPKHVLSFKEGVLLAGLFLLVLFAVNLLILCRRMKSNAGKDR